MPIWVAERSGGKRGGGNRGGRPAGGDGLGQEDRQQERGLPQVAALALAEQEGGVARGPGRAEHGGDGQDLQPARRIEHCCRALSTAGRAAPALPA